MFTDDVIDAYIELKMQEVTRLRMTHAPGRVRYVLQRLTGAGKRCSGAGRLGGPAPLPRRFP